MQGALPDFSVAQFVEQVGNCTKPICAGHSIRPVHTSGGVADGKGDGITLGVGEGLHTQSTSSGHTKFLHTLMLPATTLQNPVAQSVFETH